LLKKYFWYGYGGYRSYNKDKTTVSLPRMTPPAGVLAGLFYSLEAYKKLYRKVFFLLPLFFGLKMTAWSTGFFKGQIADLVSHKTVDQEST
jgi:hypothetical protein